MIGALSASQIFVGVALTFGLAAACQIVASKLGIPAIILLLPVGFVAGVLTVSVNPDKLFGAAFPPLVSLAVAIILFDGGLDLTATHLKGDSSLVVRRLRGLGIPITWAGAGFFAWILLGLSWRTALMLGAILIVSGPTVVTPSFEQRARARRSLRSSTSKAPRSIPSEPSSLSWSSRG